MRQVLTIIIFVLFSGSVFAQDELFSRARAAYDDGRYGEAATLYEKMVADGYNNPEIHYNLGNACFKNSELSSAVLHYRKASYDLPRDPDIKANLQFALNAAGATAPNPAFTERFFSALASGEWVALATVGYLILTIIFLLILFMPDARRPLIKSLIFPTVILTLSVFGWRHWKGLEINPEWVVVQTEATALFGPVEGSTAHFKLPLAALVKQRSTDGKGWVEVEYDGKQGWLKAEYISRVSP